MTFDPEAWHRDLAHAFAVLLGRPLDAFPATAEYALFTWNDELSFLMLEDLLSGDLDLAALARGEVEEAEGDAYPDDSPRFGWEDLPADHPGSLWVFEEDLLEEDGGLGGRIGPALRAVASGTGHERTVSGADLLRVLAEHADDLGEADGDELMGRVQWLQRVRTDGTLLAAMRAATWTLNGPDELVPFEPGAEVEPAWDEALRSVADPRLRDHLRMLCLTAHWARSDGAYYLGQGECPHDFTRLAERPGYETVTGWEFGEGQASSAVFQIK
ncbi:hypothetical protein EDD29_5790 [Actinocorallia herbida]|uniref:Uncharacterized protein n=1 Tax=Actinocorallia herbida TaxID=58109 RepID=A0A3N1D3Q2_9ACTN|nr:hypothetical protein [Actinocorallia herbida]ROO88130.1 hypothetical protein EDD29_5790 [Actinocorallia herbida]